MSTRVGRNQRFDAAGNALTAAGLGLIAQWFSKSAVFFGVALFAVPTFVALSWIRPKRSPTAGLATPAFVMRLGISSTCAIS